MADQTKAKMEIPNLPNKKQFFKSLNERQKRHFAALLAEDLGFGGQKIVGQALCIDTDTIRKGANEMANNDGFPLDRVRKKGGGAKK